LHPDGLVLTAAHVIRGRSTRITLPGGDTEVARVLRTDEQRDLAVLAVDAGGLPAVRIGQSSRLRPGEWVMAVGHPWGVAGAATSGVVIGVGADLPEAPGAVRGLEWIASDLHVRPGHSGGPLVDAAGHLVGINTMMAGPHVGLAVPAHVAKAFLKEALPGTDGSADRTI
jgi:serine protease Do